MKTTLKISVLLNLGLFSGLVYLLAHGPEGATTSSAPVETQARPAMEVPPPPQAAAPAQPRPFRWGQLESANYQAYVKNLRDIGCPEHALRAIVTADLETVYAARKQELRTKLTALENGSWSDRVASYDTRQALQAALAKLPGEETSQITAMLQLNPAPAPLNPAAAQMSPGTAPLNSTPAQSNQAAEQMSPATTQVNSDPIQLTPGAAQLSPSTAQLNSTMAQSIPATGQLTPAALQPVIHDSSRQAESAASSQPDAPVTMPLAFQKVDPAALNLNAEQLKAIDNVQQHFLQQVGSTTQDPTDPSYLANWQAAQPAADSRLEAMIGYQAYMQYEIAAMNQRPVKQ